MKYLLLALLSLAILILFSFGYQKNTASQKNIVLQGKNLNIELEYSLFKVVDSRNIFFNHNYFI